MRKAFQPEYYSSITNLKDYWLQHNWGEGDHRRITDSNNWFILFKGIRISWIGRRLPTLLKPEYVQHTLRFQWERWDGRGPAYGVKAAEVPLGARILHFAQVLEIAYGFGGQSFAKTMAREKRGTRFDPEVVDGFLSLAEGTAFWDTLEQETCQDDILAMRPPTSIDHITTDQTEQVCEVLADIVDIKTRETWHHSRLVAEVAVGIGSRLGLSAMEQTKLRCAALVHDVGKVAIPYGVLVKGNSRSKGEWEMYYLHPYHT